MQKKLFDANDKKTFKKLICEKYFIEKFVVKEFVMIKKIVAIKFIDMQQNQNEIIKKYYQRIHNIFVEIDFQNILLFEMIRNRINDFNNKKLSKHLINKFIQNLFDAYIIAKRKFRQKKSENVKKKIN